MAVHLPRTTAIAAAAALVLTLVGAVAPAPAGARTPGVAPRSGGLPEGAELFALDPAAFTTDIDNPWWPMTPGTRWTSRETDANGARQQVVVTVTSERKEIANGVTARIVRDIVTAKGEVVEDTFDWYAQDADGNIWYLGEDTAEFDNGEVTSRAGSFEAGVDGALAGVAVPADPVVGLRYRQEHYAGEAEDQGDVVLIGAQAEVPAGHYDDVLMTADTNPLHPRVLEFKFYAPGVGPVLAIGVSGSSDREELLRQTVVGARAAKAAATTPLGQRYP